VAQAIWIEPKPREHSHYQDFAMKHSQISRNSAKAFFAFAALALVGACADNSAVAPTAEAPAFVAPANFAQTGYMVVFRVNNSEGTTKKIGNHLINIPAGAICDLATSGYGATQWDKPCQALRGSIVIKATVLQDADGQPYIDFQPAMRFAPNKEVTLFLLQGKNTAKKQLIVNYCTNLGFCSDESLTDASLAPFRIGNTPVIGRRLKHFSGYMVAWAGDCTGSVASNGDGTYWCEGGSGGMTRRSGYMVASGEDVSDAMKDSQNGKDGEKDNQ
jgi:hypothetical protein